MDCSVRWPRHLQGKSKLSSPEPIKFAVFWVQVNINKRVLMFLQAELTVVWSRQKQTRTWLNMLEKVYLSRARYITVNGGPGWTSYDHHNIKQQLESKINDICQHLSAKVSLQRRSWWWLRRNCFFYLLFEKSRNLKVRVSAHQNSSISKTMWKRWIYSEASRRFLGFCFV